MKGRVLNTKQNVPLFRMFELGVVFLTQLGQKVALCLCVNVLLDSLLLSRL